MFYILLIVIVDLWNINKISYHTPLYVGVKYWLYILHSIKAYVMSCTENTIHTCNTKS